MLPAASLLSAFQGGEGAGGYVQYMKGFWILIAMGARRRFAIALVIVTCLANTSATHISKAGWSE